MREHSPVRLAPLTDKVDHSADEIWSNAQAPQDLLVFVQNVIRYKPDEIAFLGPFAQQIGARILPRTYGFLKPEMPATRTFVSTTPRDFCFSTFRDNGDLRRSCFLTVGANCLQDLLIRDFADLFSRLSQRLEKLLLPAPAFAAAR
jgi:hypothetical protein